MKKIIYILFLVLLAVKANAQVQLVSGGTGAAYTLTYPGVVTLTPGISITFKANVANTASCTIDVNGLGAVIINKNSNQALVAGDIAADQFVTIIYDGTKFQMVTPSSASSGGFANTSLSNLTSTSINQSLVPNTNATRNLGSAALAWNDIQIAGKLYINNGAWTSLVPNNTLIGTKGGESFSSGLYNLGVGQGSGNSINTGYRNTVIGHRAGELLTSQSDNTFVGNLAGGLTSAVGNDNTFLGSYAGYGSSNSGSRNTFLGVNVGGSNTTGSYNAYVGANSAYSATSGGFNTVVGSDAGQNLTTGSTNTFIGYNTGFTTATQRSNATAIGYNATVDANDALILGSNANVGIGITTPGKLTGTTRYLSVAGTQTGISNGTASLELIGNTASYNTMASKVDFLGLMPITNVAVQRARIEARSGASQTLAGQLTFWTNNGTNASSIFERMRITEAGRVGIGTATPAEILDVTGNVRFSQALMPNGVAGVAGQILQSNGPGVAPTWVSTTSNNWALTGNASTDPVTNFIGTTDVTTLNFRVNNVKSGIITDNLTAFGYNSAKVGYGNTALGTSSLRFNTSGMLNTAIGIEALMSNSIGSFNTAVGDSALNSNMAGHNNTGIGVQSLMSNISGINNTALGFKSGEINLTGTNNTFIGYMSNASINSLSNATAIGANALVSQSNALILGNGANVGIGTSTPSYDLSFGGNIGRSVGLERNTVANTAGNILRIVAGGATLAATNKNGGTLNIAAGISTGTGASTINFLTSTPGTSGTTDNLQSIKMTINGNGDVGIGVTTPQTRLEVSGDVAFRGLQIALAASFTIDVSANSYSYIRTTSTANVTCNGGTAITNGSVVGQILILENYSSFTATYIDGANIQLAGGVGYVMGLNDTLTLIWNGTDWIEISRSDN